ncbi:MAG: nucleotidyl transferase AbiEii/AbiGii toxin family protein [Patescibacteria group bacterium]
MMIELLDRTELALINKVLKYPLAIAEKDYFLALTSKVIFDSALKNKLIFKGGTALHHVYLPQLRFSEDLDFSSNAQKIELAEMKQIFAASDIFEVKKEYVSGATIKIEKLQYRGPLGLANSLKVEIDFLQNVILPPLELDYQNVYGVKTKVRVMDIREIAAEKIRAMNDRVRYRDFYDFTMILLKLKINLKEVEALLPQKEIRKTISPENILNNWRLAQQDKAKESSSIYFSEELSDEQIEKQLSKLAFSPLNKITGETIVV